MNHHALSIVSTILLLSLGCGSDRSGEDAVAVFRDGWVSAADVDAGVLELPASHRHPPDGDFAKWYGDLAQGIALERIVQAEAKRDGLDQTPEFLRLEEGLRRRATVSVFLRRELAKTDPIPGDELRAFYEAHQDEFRRSASRHVFHIFKRFTPSAPTEVLRERLEDLRQRIVSGEDFGSLASQYSDSETRHDGGLLGWITPGQLSPDLDRIIFSLEVGTVSPPISSESGLHLFLVKAATDEKDFTFDEVRVQILNRIQLQRRADAIEAIAAAALPENSFIPKPEELQALLNAGEPESVVLRFGTWSMRLREFRDALLAADIASGQDGTTLYPMVVLNSLRQRELIYLHCQQHGIDTVPAVEEQLERLRAQELVDFTLRRRLLETVNNQEQRLLDHYQSNRRRFVEPLRLHVERFSMPITARANEDLARLEQSREALDRGDTSLSALAAELDGHVDDLGWMTLDQMAADGGRMAQVASRLTSDRHSPPWRTEDHLELVRVIARREPRELSFEDARQQVLSDFLLHHGQEAHEEMIQALLHEADFETYPDRLAALHQKRLDEAHGVREVTAGTGPGEGT